MKSYLTAFLLALAPNAAGAFAPSAAPSSRSTTLRATNEGPDVVRASAALGLYFLALVGTADVASAASFVESPSVVLAGRSGGRGGGRASSGGYRAAPRGGGYSGGGSRVYVAPSRTTIIAPRVGMGMGSPFGYGYSPFGGIGLGYGLGAMNNGGNNYREYEQNKDIARTEAELAQSKAKEAELEARLRALEGQQRIAPLQQIAPAPVPIIQ